MPSTFERIKEIYTFINSEINKHYPSAYVWGQNYFNMPLIVSSSPKSEVRKILFRNMSEKFNYFVISPNTFKWDDIELSSFENKLVEHHHNELKLEFLKYLEEISTVENIEKAIAIYKLQKD